MKNYLFSLMTLFLISCQADYLSIKPTFITTPQAPGNFTLSELEIGNSKVTLKWSASENADKYIVAYEDGSGTPATEITDITGLEYEVSGLTNGLTYTFSVKAVNDIGEADSLTKSAEAVFIDEFNGVMLDREIWQTASLPDPISWFGSFVLASATQLPEPIQTEGHLVFIKGIPVVGLDFTQAVETKESFNMTNSWISTELIVPAEGNNETGLWILDENARGWEILVRDGDLSLISFPSEDYTAFQIEYDPIAHRHLRIRQKSDYIHFEAFDGSFWTALRTIDITGSTIDIENMHFTLYVYLYATDSFVLNDPIAKFNQIKSNAPMNLH